MKISFLPALGVFFASCVCAAFCGDRRRSCICRRWLCSTLRGPFQRYHLVDSQTSHRREARKCWFTNQSDIALYLNPTLTTSTAKPPTFPLLTKVSYQDAAAGQVSLPVEYTLVDSLSLKQASATYTGIQLEVTLLNENSRSSWGRRLLH